MDQKKKNVIMLAAIILIACCLRSPITGLGPVIPMISAELSLSGSAAGMLTTIPLLAFALVSLFTSALARRFGAGYVMLCGIIVTIAGILIRSFLGIPGLFAGSVVLGLGIGVNNVLLPAVIKTGFPSKIGTITGTYTTVMAACASISGAIAVPLALRFGWRISILAWGCIAFLALIAWLPGRKIKLTEEPVRTKRRSVARSSMTWWITLYMGLQSIMFYCFVAWFATMAQSKGYSETTAGILNSIMMLCGLPGSFIMAVVAGRTRHLSFWGAFLGFLYTVGMLSMIFAENPVAMGLAMFGTGFGSGACLSLCMLLFNIHTRDAQDASSVSALAQGLGYLVSAIGPVFMGRIFDMAGTWTVPLLILTGIGMATMVFGWLSGRDRIIDTAS